MYVKKLIVGESFEAITNQKSLSLAWSTPSQFQKIVLWMDSFQTTLPADVYLQPSSAAPQLKNALILILFMIQGSSSARVAGRASNWDKGSRLWSQDIREEKKAKEKHKKCQDAY